MAWRDYDSLGALTLRRALKMLREDVEDMNYHPARPTIHLDDGTWLQPRLARSSGGGDLAGCWEAVRYGPRQDEVIARYDL